MEVDMVDRLAEVATVDPHHRTTTKVSVRNTAFSELIKC